jgi:hypothetical protein
MLFIQTLIVLSASIDVFNQYIYLSGRLAIGMFISSILYSAWSKRWLAWPLVALTSLLFVFYFVERLVRFSVDYYIT